MQSVSMSKFDKIKWLITIIITAIILCVPSGGLYTIEMKKFLVITVFSLMIIAFEFFPPSVMVILLPVLYIIFGVAPVDVVMSPWISETMLLILGAFMLSAVLAQTGVLTRVAYYLMSFVNGSYTKLLIGVFFVGVVLTFATFGNGHLILAPLCAGLCVALNVMKSKMAAGIAMACMIGTCTSHTFSYPVANYAVITGTSAGLADDTFASMSLLSVVAHNFPMFFVALLTVFLIAKWYKPDQNLESADFCKQQLAKLGKIRPEEKKSGILLLITIAYTLLCPLIGLNMNWGFMLIPWLAFFPIIRCADKETLKYMNWEMVFFMSGCMAIGSVAASLGFSSILSNLLGVLFSSGSITMIFAILFLVIFLMNFLMTPMAIWALITAPVMQIAIDMGLNQLPFMYALLSCTEAIILPYEYAPYLIVYAFGMIKMGDFIKLNALRCILFFLGFIFVLIPYWKIIGLL